jgi:hypothetical protein
LLANGISFAGYIQASSNQDLAFLSANVGDSSFNVTFSSGGQIDFSYFSAPNQQNATLNLIDSTVVPQSVLMSAMAGTFTISNPNGQEVSGNLLVLPPIHYFDFSNASVYSLSEIVAGDSVVTISSLFPAAVLTGECPYCAPPPPFFNNSLFHGFGPADEAPEPSTFAFFGIGLVALATVASRRARVRREQAAKSVIST